MRVGAPLVGALYNNEKNNKKIDRINVIINVNNRAPIKGAPTATLVHQAVRKIIIKAVSA